MNKIIATNGISLENMIQRNKLDLLNKEIEKTGSFEKSIKKFQWMTK